MLQTINPQTGMVETCREHSPVPRTIYGRGEVVDAREDRNSTRICSRPASRKALIVRSTHTILWPS